MNARRAFVMISAIVLLGLAPMTATAQTGEGYIEGRLINEATGEPLADWVSVLAFDESETLVAQMVEPSDPDGHYRLGPLPPGSYKLQFMDARITGILPEWWPDQPDFTSAGLVEVAPGMVTENIDFYLARPIDTGGWISGTVTDTANQMPLPSINWSLYDLEGNLVGPGDRTDSSGRYRAENLGSGSFKLAFGDSTYFAYEPAWYGGASFESAAVLVVAEGEELSDINVALALRSGTATPILPFGGIPATEYLTTALLLIVIGCSMVVLATRIKTTNPVD